jgi:hypothetical protein
VLFQGSQIKPGIVHTRLGTELSRIWTFICFQVQKCDATVFADSFYGPVTAPASFHNNKEFGIANLIFSIPGAVTAVAGRYQIFGRVVPPIVVKMVNGDSPLHVLLAGEPFKRASTPMARMEARADFLVENDSVFLNGAVLRREGVKGVADTPVASVTAFLVSPCCLSPARHGTKLPFIGANLPTREGKLFPTELAIFNHDSVIQNQYPIVKENVYEQFPL